MKTLERQESVVKEFLITDINGVGHYAILVGVLQVSKSTEWLNKGSTVITKKGSHVVTTFTEWKEDKVFKSLSMGLTINNPEDVYNVEYGTLRAKGRALKPSKRLGYITTEHKAMLGIDMCSAIMDQQIKFIQENAGLFIKVKKAAEVVETEEFKQPESVQTN